MTLFHYPTFSYVRNTTISAIETNSGQLSFIKKRNLCPPRPLKPYLHITQIHYTLFLIADYNNFIAGFGFTYNEDESVTNDAPQLKT